MVKKRNNTKEVFDRNKIEKSIKKAIVNMDKTKHRQVVNISNKIEKLLISAKEISSDFISSKVEKYMMESGLYDAAKKYIIYREDIHKNNKGKEYYLDRVDEYRDKSHWEVKENSNAHYSYGAMNKHLSGLISKDYWLDRVYPEYIKQSFLSLDIKNHDSGDLTIYCCGYSLGDIITKGVTGVSNIPTSAPAKHFSSLLAQVGNLVTIYQNEIAGAVAFSSFDTLTAPFVKKDDLSYSEVKQIMQNFLFQINSNSRGGSEPAFSNLTFDLMVTKDMKNSNVIVAGEEQDFQYKDCQREMDMVNKAFYEVMLEGDADGNMLPYPIPTYNIHKEFDWDRPNEDMLWEMTGKYGIPYFANFINSDMNPEDARSMCCRLRLDKRELRRRGGGLFGAGEKTGSIGVMTLNLPRYAYEANSEKELLEIIDKNMEIAKDALVIKREFLQKTIKLGQLPAFSEYVGTLDNHFSTIGYIGANEMCQNLLRKDIISKEGYDLTYKVLTHMIEKLKDFQEETGDLYNLEASPAESSAYAMAKKDKEIYPDIITQGDIEPYYTNSCHIPVKKAEDIDSLYKHQHKLQSLHTGGTVVHNYLETSISGEKAKDIIKYISENYEAPYTSLSPVYSTCPKHGFISGNVDKCPHCGEKTTSYQRITGYVRPVDKFNAGKKAEFEDRNQLKGEV